jgi:hypothetical protein
VLRVSDGNERASQAARLVVYQSDQPLSHPSKWRPSQPPNPRAAGLEQGFGFLVLWLVHLLGMNTLGNLERWALGKAAPAPDGGDDDGDSAAAGANDEADAWASAEAAAHRGGIRRRFSLYRMLVRLASLSGAVALAVWLARPRG